MSTNQPRTPAGSPTGGQFAGVDRPESTALLDVPAAVVTDAVDFAGAAPTVEIVADRRGSLGVYAYDPRRQLTGPSIDVSLGSSDNAECANHLVDVCQDALADLESRASGVVGYVPFDPPEPDVDAPRVRAETDAVHIDYVTDTGARGTISITGVDAAAVLDELSANAEEASARSDDDGFWDRVDEAYDRARDARAGF